MAKKSKKQSFIEKAATLYGYKYDSKNDSLTADITPGCNLTLSVSDGKLHVLDSAFGMIDCVLPEEFTYGDFIRNVYWICERRRKQLSSDNISPPNSLKNGGKDFEELIVKEAKRLEVAGILTMCRYGTTAIMTEEKLWMPVPSLPDFEGVRAGGAQFIIEAKVCSGHSFRINKLCIKHKQVRHMLRRHAFGVKCFVLIHFNERLGNTFYDPPFTVAVPVKPGTEMGGWTVWEDFAKEKDLDVEYPAITRELAARIGIPVRWYMPGKNKTAVPDIDMLIPQPGA